MRFSIINKRLKGCGLKVTPQRVAVLEALIENKTHPDAESLISIIKNDYPNISTGTIYNILDIYVEKGIIEKMYTDSKVMRYDFFVEDHHHIYLKENNEIHDFYDDELTTLVRNYLGSKNEIKNIDIESIKISIIGKRKL
jgi:Fur family peroxide stress response transcriptional regulator